MFKMKPVEYIFKPPFTPFKIANVFVTEECIVAKPLLGIHNWGVEFIIVAHQLVDGERNETRELDRFVLYNTDSLLKDKPALQRMMLLLGTGKIVGEAAEALIDELYDLYIIANSEAVRLAFPDYYASIAREE